ncbi:MAG: thiamine ABC transporter substrate-binding protein [Kutzneria sp.]|nr:thiamine ABC transporter substrate-binding protein [Kutzneria sp.]MBV9845930.1 thiamine ABC transporter substrate-binding protein [Kutzneria sp.]
MTAVTRLLAALLVVGLTCACSLIGSQTRGGSPHAVTLVTHNSWAVDKALLADFQKTSGITITVSENGDAGALATKLVLTKTDPIGDLAYGVDSTFASRALAEGVFVPYRSQNADKGSQRYQLDDTRRLTAIDVGDVCVNVDTGWFAEKGLAVPTTFADLADPRYKGLLVVENPATSSPGLAFLLGTMSAFGGSGWLDYWTRLKANDVKVDAGWNEAYSQDFSGSAGKGPRPVVVSYASSPAAEIDKDGKPRTRALLDTCYRQVEYAGVLAGARNPDDAKKVLDFLMSTKFQEQLPGQMYVYPARADVPLPGAWSSAAPLPPDAARLAPDQVQANRDQWVGQWRTLFTG